MRVLADTPLSSFVRVQSPQIIPNLRYLKNLKNLSISLHKTIIDLQFLRHLPPLRSLTVWAESITSLDALEAQSSLDTFRADISETDDLSFLRYLINLKTLYMAPNSMRNLDFLKHVSTSSALESLGLTGLYRIGTPDYEKIALMSGLKELELYMCNRLESLACLGDLSKLRSLTLTYANLTDGIREIANSCPELLVLHLVGAEWITSLGPLAALPLREVIIDTCPRLTDLMPLADLEHLEFLEIRKSDVADLSPLKQSRELAFLSLRDNQHIEDLSPLADIPKLRYLTLTLSDRYRGLDRLEGRVRLDWIPPRSD